MKYYFWICEKVGLKKHQILIMCSFSEMSETIKYFKDTDTKEIQYVFTSIIKELFNSYEKINEIYKDKDLWAAFSNDCVLYCAGMHVLYNKEIPYISSNELKKNNMLVTCKKII